MRIAWLTLSGLTAIIFIAGIPSLVAQLQTACTAAVCFGWQLTTSDAQALERQSITISFYAVYVVALNVLFLLSFLGVAALIMWRRGWDRSAVLMALVLSMFATAEAIDLLGTVWNLPDVIWNALIATSSMLLFLLFPNGKFVPRWTGRVVLLPSISILIGVLIPQWSQGLSGISELASYLLGIGAQIYRYRHVSTPTERQQTKWAVFGIALATVSFICLSLIGGFFPQTGTIASGGLVSLTIDTIWPLSYTLIPVSIGIAILRSRLYDIDVIIRRTLIYGALTAMLVVFYFVCVVALQELLRGLSGQGSEVAIVVSTLTVAALFNPLRRRVQSAIDRRFFRRKYDVVMTLEAFSRAARDEVDLGRLADRLVEVVDETMQPAHVGLWLSAPGQASSDKRPLEARP